MAGTGIHLFLDTSYLWKTGFNTPDFQKLLQFSKERQIRILVPHIAWEERRTQLTEELRTQMHRVRRDVEDLKSARLAGITIRGLTPIALNAWTDIELDEQSQKTMAAFADENKIEIVAIGTDHAHRTWDRYFKAAPPFNPDQPREHRRKDIPDCWIFECALDLTKEGTQLYALCRDGSLEKALKSIGVTVFGETRAVVDAINEAVSPKPAATAELPTFAIPVDDVTKSNLDNLLAQTRERVRDIDTRVLGFVGYLGSPRKDELLSLLSQSGMAPDLNRRVWFC